MNVEERPKVEGALGLRKWGSEGVSVAMSRLRVWFANEVCFQLCIQMEWTRNRQEPQLISDLLHICASPAISLQHSPREKPEIDAS